MAGRTGAGQEAQQQQQQQQRKKKQKKGGDGAAKANYPLFGLLAGVSAMVAAMGPTMSDRLWEQLQMERSAVKAYSTWEDFYPFYLTEHSDVTCRRLHVVGTSIVILLSLVYMSVLPSLVVAGAMGYGMYFVCMPLDHGFVDMAIMMATFLLSVKFLTGDSRKGLMVIFLAYGFAWVGHFFFEHNRPATFTYPVFSLISDFRMWYAVVSGELSF